MSSVNNAQPQLLRECARRILALADELESKTSDAEAIQQSRTGLLGASWSSRSLLTEGELLERATLEYRTRQQRSRYLPQELFGEPAWDMLVDLFVAALQRRNISVSSACLASGVPATTALRWLRLLEQMGLVERSASPHDHRVVLVRLSDQGFQAMTNYYSESERKVAPKATTTDERTAGLIQPVA